MRPSTARVYQLRHPNIGGQSRIRTSEIPKGYRVYSAALSANSANCPSELSKIWRKAGDSNAYVPRDPGLADQWDTNYPSLPGTNFNLDLEGNYRLDERHQDCPTVSRYHRRPRLKKCRIYSYFTVESLFGQGLNGSGELLDCHAAPARTSSIRNRTPWLSEGFSQSMRLKILSASSNPRSRQRHSPNPFMHRRNGRLSIQPQGSRPLKFSPSDNSPIRSPTS